MHYSIRRSLAACFLVLFFLSSSISGGPAFAQSEPPIVPQAAAPTEAGSDAQYLEPVWATTEWVSSGESGMSLVDLDDDGNIEILYGGTFAWQIISYSQKYNTYSIEFTSQKNTKGLLNVIAARPGAGMNYRIYSSTHEGTVEVYDGKTRQHLAVLTVDDRVCGMAMGDIDADGSTELLLRNRKGFLYVMDPLTYAVKWSGSVFSAYSDFLYLGNIDHDPALEIISHKQVIDGQTKQVQWEIATFPNLPHGGTFLLDLDSDGMDEIIEGFKQYPGRVDVYDGDLQILKWTMNIPFLVSLTVADYDADNIIEFAVSNENYGIDVYNIQDQTLEMHTKGTESSYDDIAYGDTDGDGANELVLDTGLLEGPPHHLSIANGTTGQWEFLAPQPFGPFSAVDVGDVDGDSKLEIISVAANRYPYMGTSGIIFVYDAETRELKWNKELSSALNPDTKPKVKLEDLDFDGVLDIVVFYNAPYSHSHSNPSASILSGVTQQWIRFSDNPFSSDNGNTHPDLFDFTDVDGDGQDELVKSEEKYINGVIWIVVDAVNIQTRAIEWSVQLPDSPGSIGTGTARLRDQISCNADSDPTPEILVAGLDGIRMVDGQSHAEEWHPKDAAVDSLACADVNGDGLPEILAGTEDGFVKVYDARAKKEESAHLVSPTPDPLYGLRLTDFNNDGAQELLVTDRTRLYVLLVSSWKTLWSSPVLGADSTGWFNQIVSADINSDGRQEVLAGSDYWLYIFRHNPDAPGNTRPAVVSTTPFEGEQILHYMPFIVTFNEPVLPETVTVSCTPDPGGWKVEMIGDMMYRLYHQPFPNGKIISCAVTNAEEEFGLTLANPFTWSFTTDPNPRYDLFVPVMH